MSPRSRRGSSSASSTSARSSPWSNVRPAEAYRKGCLPGARSVPLGDLARRAGEIPRAGRVVLYADILVEMVEAQRLLQKRGHDNVEILEGGFAEWVKRGLPVEPGR